VITGLVAFVITVYVVVVLGGGVLIGKTSSPSLPLSVLATAIVALAFEPVQARLERAAAELLRGGAPSPYEVLSRFSENVTGSYPTEELPSRMATLLGEGTGAAWAQVWLTVQGELTLAASWPETSEPVTEPPRLAADARDSTGELRRAVSVRHAGALLGVLRLQERPGSPLTSVEERLFTGLAAQAGLVLRLAGLRAELAARHAELLVRADELRLSRERLIETQDAERRRLERDIHDGAQQHLVALAVNLRLAETVAAKSPERAAKVLEAQSEAAREAIDTLTQLSRGIYPRLLADEGMVQALRAALVISPIPVRVEAVDVPRLYFCCMEAVQNAAKHSLASRVTVTVGTQDGSVRMTVDDDGEGFDVSYAEPGAGLTNMRDRIDAAGGQLQMTSTPGVGTRVDVHVPLSQMPEQRSS
jgi:signal transduction histidine kinase